MGGRIFYVIIFGNPPIVRKNKISTPSGVLIRYVEKPIGLNATAMR